MSGSRDAFWLVNGTVVDPAGGTVVQADVEVSDGRIQRIGDGPAVLGPNDVDLAGRYILPGLITCHAHLQATYPHARRDPNEPVGVTAIRAARTARMAPSLGITTVRSLHEQGAVDIAVRRAIAAGWATGPRILGAGRAITVSGGHGEGFGCRVADGPEAVFEAGIAELDGGADHLKLYISGGLARADEDTLALQMSHDEMAAAVRAASERSTYVVAHASSSAAIAGGLAAGIRAFEHAYELDAATAAEMAEAGAFLTPTLVVTHSPDWMRDEGFDATAIGRILAAGERHLESIQRAVAAGVRLVNGTDSPPDAQSTGTSQVVREVELMVEAGLTPLDAIRGATSEAAALLRLPDVGRVAEGAVADLIVVDGDPLAGAAALRRIVRVIQDGRMIEGVARG